MQDKNLRYGELLDKLICYLADLNSDLKQLVQIKKKEEEKILEVQRDGVEVKEYRYCTGKNLD